MLDSMKRDTQTRCIKLRTRPVSQIQRPERRDLEGYLGGAPFLLQAGNSMITQPPVNARTDFLSDTVSFQNMPNCGKDAELICFVLPCIINGACLVSLSLKTFLGLELLSYHFGFGIMCCGSRPHGNKRTSMIGSLMSRTMPRWAFIYSPCPSSTVDFPLYFVHNFA